MSNEVVIKSNRKGVNLVLSEDAPFPKLLQNIGDKFRETGSFFKDARVAVTYTGRTLSAEEREQIVEAIMSNSDVRVESIAPQDSGEDGQAKRRTQGEAGRTQTEPGRTRRRAAGAAQAEAYGREQMYVPEGTGDFYKGNLRSGQVLESASNITLIGDVNPGAHIISQGNIVILGSLKGTASAGANCFIFALDMRPIQLQIGEYIAKSPDREKKQKRLFKKEKETAETYSSNIAVVRNGNICIEPMTKGCLDQL